MASASVHEELAVEHPWLSADAKPFAGKYRVVRIIGQGGMGVVFEARHIRMGHRVAIKVLGSALRDCPELVERFEREARAAGSLTSSHTVRVFDIDATEDGTPFIVMELLTGRDLSTIIERDGPQPMSRAVRWIIEACEAIAEAHRMGVIHRDLKPSNLFLTDVEGRKVVKVLDFGIAKRMSTEETAITQALAPLGTPQYMSPEQVRCAKDVDSRTDVWSLGVTLYELVCGSTPFAHQSASACIASIAADPVPDPRGFRVKLPDRFVAVLMRALAKSPNDRYGSVDALVEALAPFALDDSFDDEEMASAVRRALDGSAPPHTPRERVTLDGGLDVPRPASVPPSPVLLPPVPLPGLPPESRRDHTVPPAVSPSPSPRPSRSTFARSSALAAMGVAALVLVPYWLATGADEPSIRHASAPPNAAVADPVPAPAPTTIDVVEPASQEASSPAEAPVQPRVVAMAAPATSLVHAKIEKKAPPVVIRASMHGGLSNPGF